MSKAGKRGGIEVSLSWLPSMNGQVPANAVSAGQGLYIARAKIGNDVIPGKFKMGYPHAHFPYNSTEVSIPGYEVLSYTGLGVFGKEYHWKSMGNGSVPAGAVVGGYSYDHIEPLYIARARVYGELCVGKVVQSRGAAYIPYDGKEVRVNNYEVLTFKT